jgi:hypothetical protein
MLLHSCPVQIGGMRANCLHQPPHWWAQLATRRHIHTAQCLPSLEMLRNLFTNRYWKGARGVNVRGRHAKRQQAIRTVEPLLVIVNQATTGVRHERPGHRHPDLTDRRCPGSRLTHLRVAAISPNQEINFVERFARTGLDPLKSRLRRIRLAGTDPRNRCAVSNMRCSSLTQDAIELRPTDAPAIIVGNGSQRQVEQKGPVGKRDLPAAPWQACRSDCQCKRGVVHP